MFLKNLGLALIGALAMATLVAHERTETLEYTFPPIALGAPESAEISVGNIAANASNGMLASCTVSVSFINFNGMPIGSPSPFQVGAGQTLRSVLAYAATGGAPGSRTVIRGIVKLIPPTTNVKPPCELEFSLSTFDTITNATHTLLAGPGPLSTKGH